MLSGGMSVDPDDVTRQGIRAAGAGEMHYGAAVLPGAMFLVAYIGDIPLLGVPACGLYHRITVLDLVLPRILAGEKIGKAELAFLGHGGLCKDCHRMHLPPLPLRQVETVLNTRLVSDSCVVIRTKMLAYYRVRSAFEPNRALLSSTIQAFKTVSKNF